MQIPNHGPIYAGPEQFIQTVLNYYAQQSYFPTVYDVNGITAMASRYISRYKTISTKNNERIIFYISKSEIESLIQGINPAGFFAIFNVVDQNDPINDYRLTQNLTLAPFTVTGPGTYSGIKDQHGNIISLGIYCKDQIGSLASLSINTSQTLPQYFEQRNIDYDPGNITGPPGVNNRNPSHISSNNLARLIEEYCDRVDNYVGKVHHDNEFSILLIDIQIILFMLEILGNDEGILAIKGVYEDEEGFVRQTTILCPCTNEWQAKPLVPGGGVLGFERWPPEQTRSVEDLLNGSLSQNVAQYLNILNLD